MTADNQMSLLELDFARVPLILCLLFMSSYAFDVLVTSYRTNNHNHHHGPLDGASLTPLLQQDDDHKQTDPGLFGGEFDLLYRLVAGGVLQVVVLNVLTLPFAVLIPFLLRGSCRTHRLLSTLGYGLFQMGLLSIPPLLLSQWRPDYSPLAGACLSLQSCVYSMKAHSIFWAPYSSITMSFVHCLRFIFLPVLVYKDEYFLCHGTQAESNQKERKKRFDVLFFLKETSLGIISLFLVYLIINHWLIPIATEQFPVIGFLHTWLRLVIPSVSLLYISFFGVLHCLQNAIAEIWGHEDRRSFYQDWWNAHDFAEWSRSWNSTVQNWIASIYNVLRHGPVFQWSRDTATFASIMMSALFHDYVLLVSFRQLSFWTSMFMSLLFVMIWIIRHAAIGRLLFGTNGFVHTGIFIVFPLLVLSYTLCFTWVASPVCLPRHVFRLSLNPPTFRQQ